jgi:di/tricarboxylate transporter
MGLMVVHGAAAGNFSPLNVLGAIVHQAVTSRGLEMSVWTLFAGNLTANLAIAVVLVMIFRKRRPFAGATGAATPVLVAGPGTARPSLALDQICTIAALVAVAVIALGFGLSIGFLAFGAAAILQLAFPKSSEGAERLVAWGVVLLVCGVVTYVGALQRYGTITAAGQSIASLGSPLVVALLLCGVGAITSAFASSAGILGAMIPLAAPFMAQGLVGTTGFVTALALSATLVDATPFSTVGALAVANASDSERRHVYNGMLAWGASMVVIAPIVTWLVFVLPGRW